MKGGSNIRSHLSFELPSNPKLLISFDDEMEVIKILDYEALLLVHREQDLLHGRVAVGHARVSDVMAETALAGGRMS